MKMYYHSGSIIILPTTKSFINYNQTNSYETANASELSSMETMTNDQYQHNHQHLHQHLNQHSHQRNRYHPMYISHQESGEASSLQQLQDANQRRIPYYNYLPSYWSARQHQAHMSSSRLSDSNRAKCTEDDPQQQQQSARIRYNERSAKQSLTARTTSTAFDMNVSLNRAKLDSTCTRRTQFKEASTFSTRTTGSTCTAEAKDVGVHIVTKGNNICTCKKSRCLMLYCQCFKLSVTCGVKCRCNGCNNTPNHGEQINKARRNILQKNSTAFDDPRAHVMASTQIHHETVGIVSPISSTPNTPNNAYASARYQAALAYSAQQQVLMQSTSPKTVSNRASPLLSSEVEERNEKCDTINTPVLSSNNMDTATGSSPSSGYPTTLKNQADSVQQAKETTLSGFKAERTHPTASTSDMHDSYLGSPPSLQRSSEASVFDDRRWALPGARGANYEVVAIKSTADDTTANSDEYIRRRYTSGKSNSIPGTSRPYLLMKDENYSASTDVTKPMQPVVPSTLNQRNDQLAANRRLHSQNSNNYRSHQSSSSSPISAKQNDLVIPAWDYPSQLNAIIRQGCKCQRIMCLKKYCECFSKNLACSSHCKCVDCKNASTRYMNKSKNGTSTTSSRSNDVLINQESAHYTNARIEPSVQQVPTRRSQYQTRDILDEHNDEEALSICNSLESNELDSNEEEYDTNYINAPSLSPPPLEVVVIEATKNINNEHSSLDYNEVHVQQQELKEPQRKEHDQLDIMAAIAMTELFKKSDHHYTITSTEKDDNRLQNIRPSKCVADLIYYEKDSSPKSTITNTTTGTSSMSKKRKAIGIDNNTSTTIDTYNRQEEDSILATVKKRQRDAQVVVPMM